jgi:hypothetical protein
MEELERLESESSSRRGWYVVLYHVRFCMLLGWADLVGRQNTCPTGALTPADVPKTESSFITDLPTYMDFCNRPELLKIVSLQKA